MKKSTMSIALAAALLGMTAAHASEFKGANVGINAGYNTNSKTGTAGQNKAYLGGQVGYSWDMGKVLLGVDGFVDGHPQSVTGQDAGLDVKLGYPVNKLMPYAKLGLVATNPGTRTHGGVGIEYKFAPKLSVAGEWTADNMTVNGVKYKNSNVSIGINYYFDLPVLAGK